MKVLLVDDQMLFIDGLRNLLVAHKVNVVGIAGDGLEALAKARALRPDVILMDVRMPRCDGLQATRMIKAELPDIKIVMLTVSADDEDLFGAIRSGASGYLLKSADAREFFDLLEKLSQGEVPLSKGLAARILVELARSGTGHAPQTPTTSTGTKHLTEREIGVLTLAAQGLTYSQIGATLCITEHTVKYHMRQILEHLHLRNRAQLIAYAHQAGLLPSPVPDASEGDE